MPLVRKSDRILTTMRGVKFLMTAGAAEVACRADRDLLRNRYGSHDRESDAAAFLLNRDEIERVASEKYDAGMIEPHEDAEIEVHEQDLSSPLSRKLGAAF
jgi:hypothetical protein